MPEPEAEIGFAQLGLGGVLKQNRLAVPRNQREYSWESKEVRTLFQDFAREISGPDRSYFLGTIVTIPRPLGFLEVVDGQQRLATTTILLAAMRDYLKPIEPELANSMSEEFLTVFDRDSRTRSPRLRLNVDDDDFFRQRLEEAKDMAPPTKQSHRLLDNAFKEAVRQVKNIVSELDEKDHGNELNRWVNFIEIRASVILLRVPNANNAYRMFETLNDRGKRVSQSDLVKNYLFGFAGGRLEEVQQTWAYMRGALESMEEEDTTITFLRHALSVVRGFVRDAEVYEAVQAQVKGEQPVVNFSSQLEQLAHSFVAIHNPDHERWNRYGESVRRALEVLNLFNISPMRPLILSIGHKFREDEAENAFAFCVSLAVRLMIASSTRTGTVEEALAKVANKIFVGEITGVNELRTQLASITPTDVEFCVKFEVATVSNRKLARYYLRSLELAVKKESQPWHIPNDDRSVINLEHVLPEKPLENWPQFSDDEVKVNRNRIGNLALLRASENSDLKSDGFEKKRHIYAGCPYITTSQIAEAETWTVDEIMNRQRVLASEALKA